MNNKIDMDIKKLGFGLMRLPRSNDGEDIDIETTKKMVDRFMAEGFTYFDTAWAYKGSERAIKKALVDRYPRESYTLATKLAPWIGCKTAEEAESQLEKSLERTGAGYFDFYLLHNFGDKRSHYFDDFGIWDFVKKMKEQGKIRHIGFSAHADAGEVESILRDHPEAEFVQLQINYADWDDPAIQSRKCYEAAVKFGKPVIVMEPVKGGLLAHPPASVEKIFKSADPNASLASWCIRYAAGLEGVLVVLSGMSDEQQMEDNISFMKNFVPLSEEERETIKKAAAELANQPVIPCTSCDYCAKVCPENIGISGTFTALNILNLYGDEKAAVSQEEWLVGDAGKKQAVSCIKCGKCEEACPQHISIREKLEEAAAAFNQTKK